MTECHSHDSAALSGEGGFPDGGVVKNLPTNAEEGDTEMQERRGGFNPWIGKILWSRKRQPPPVLLPGEFLGQRSLLGYSPRSCKELEALSTQTHRGKGMEWRSRDSLRFSLTRQLILKSQQLPPCLCHWFQKNKLLIIWIL